MQIKPEQLTANLSQRLLPAVWIAGDEPLLVQECFDAVRTVAAGQGFSEREVFHAHKDFEWSRLLAAGGNLSLFAEKKILDLRLPSSKLDNDAKQALQDYLADPGDDNLLLITSPKVEKAAQNTKWFKAIESRACFVPVWPVGQRDLPGWVARRMKQHGLSADREAIQVLVDRVEGNLLAASQEIEKLSLLVDSGQLDARTVARAVADSARFNVFALIDAALSGHAPRALNILSHLRGEGEEALFVLNMLCKEIRMLGRMAGAIERGQSRGAVMQQERIWKNRMNSVSTALNQHNADAFAVMLDRARRIDQAVKGLVRADPWDELADLVLHLAGSDLSQSA